MYRNGQKSRENTNNFIYLHSVYRDYQIYISINMVYEAKRIS